MGVKRKQNHLSLRQSESSLFVPIWALPPWKVLAPWKEGISSVLRAEEEECWQEDMKVRRLKHHHQTVKEPSLVQVKLKATQPDVTRGLVREIMRSNLLPGGDSRLGPPLTSCPCCLWRVPAAPSKRGGAGFTVVRQRAARTKTAKYQWGRKKMTTPASSKRILDHQ